MNSIVDTPTTSTTTRVDNLLERPRGDHDVGLVTCKNEECVILCLVVLVRRKVEVPTVPTTRSAEQIHSFLSDTTDD